MANYPKELVDLVNEYLTDGIISSKERQVLLKKAEQLGVNPEEFDLYIDAQEQKVEQQVDAAARKAKGKLCPYCKTPLPPLAEKCPECGTIIITAAVNEKIERMMTEIRVKFSQGIGHTTSTSDEKSEAIRLLHDAKMQNLEMNIMYGSVQKVHAFCSQMDVDIENAIATINSKKTYATKITRGCVIYWVISMMIISILSLVLLFVL